MSTISESDKKPRDEFLEKVGRVDDADVEEPTLHWRTWIVFLSVALLGFGVNMAISATGFWLGPTIASLGGATIAVWFPDSALVLAVAFAPIFGTLADFGPLHRKYCTIGLAILGSVGLIIAGSAKNMHIGILGATFYGGSVITYGLQAAIVAEIMPRRYRGIAQGNLYGFQAMGGVLTLLGGGAFVRYNVGGAGGWRWTLRLSAIIQVTAATLLMVFYHPLPTVASPVPYWKRIARLDWVGNALFIAGFVPFMMGIIWGGNTYPWKSAPVIATLVIGIFFIGTFTVQQYIKKDGFMNHRLFKNRNVAIALFSIFIEGFVYIALNVFLPQQIGYLYEHDPVRLGLHFSVLVFSSTVSSVFWGLFSRYYRRVREPCVLGFVLFAGACGGFSQLRPGGNGPALAYGMCALVGFGFGPPLALILATAQLSVDPDLIGIVSALIIGIRSVGGALGAAAATAIFVSKIKTTLPESIAVALEEAGVAAVDIPGLATAIVSAQGGPLSFSGATAAQIAAGQFGYLEGYARAFSYVYYLIIPFAAAAGIALAFQKSVRKQMTWEIEEPVETDEQLGVYHHRAHAEVNDQPEPHPV